MKIRWMTAGLAAGLGFFWIASRDPAATPRAQRPAPAVVLVEGDPEGIGSDVFLRHPGRATQPSWLGRVPHVAGSALRAALLPGPGTVALVVAAEHASRDASSYHSVLHRVEGGLATPLVGGLCDASAPLVTARGSVLVQRGQDGPEPAGEGAGRVLRERVDLLAIDRVDPRSGQPRRLWSGTGMIAYLAAPLRDDEALVYHVDPGGAWLLVLDAGTAAVQRLAGPLPPLARDFSYDATRDEVVFVRAVAPRSTDYEVVALPAHRPGAAPRVLHIAGSDHLMPRTLYDGAVALSLPGDLGLGLLAGAGAVPRRLAPAGDGSDAVLAESAGGRWLAVRHTTPGHESLVLYDRTDGGALHLDRPGRYVELAGFAPGGAP